MSTAFCSIGNMAPNNKENMRKGLLFFQCIFFQGKRIGETQFWERILVIGLFMWSRKIHRLYFMCIYNLATRFLNILPYINVCDVAVEFIV